MSGKNIGKQLTLDLIISKTKSNNLQTIKNLNLWGNQLENLSLIQKMPNLQVISLSVNKIFSLKDFSKCNKLQELYLRKNNIEDIKQIRYLMSLPNLKVLWLHDNPCSQVQHYRQIVIKHLPYIMKLDNNPVTQEQRVAAQSVPYSIPLEEKTRGLDISHHKYERTPTNDQPDKRQLVLGTQQKMQRQTTYKKNILMAVLSLMRQLDSKGLEIVKKQAQDLMK